MIDAVTPKSSAASAKRGGVRLWIGHAIYRLSARIHFAEPEIRGLGKFVHPGDSVLDVGAALGMYTVPLAHIVGPSGRVDSFDPQPRNFYVTRFLRSINGVKNGLIRRIALGPKPGESSIAVPIILGLPIFGHGHISEGVDEGSRRIRYTPTPVDTIDDWVTREGIARISYIKVDVEGFEPSVIEGGRATITRDLPSLMLEIEDRHLVRYGRDAAGFVGEILGMWPAYKMYTWSGNDWVRVDEVKPSVRNYLFATDAALAS
ncbi:MAG: FkbM family methyltransferase [Pseudolysinimonas sp.]|uniref:FkbM family methyltransferase n=1 Tax=Pseudolysinimonas sp. TaxID=2680009 RepID=UPI003265B081